MKRVTVDGVDKDVLEHMIDVYTNELFWLLTQSNPSANVFSRLLRYPRKDSQFKLTPKVTH